MSNKSTLVTTTTAAELIGITREAVWKAIKANRLRATRLGRDWFISIEDIEIYKKNREPK